MPGCRYAMSHSMSSWKWSNPPAPAPAPDEAPAPAPPEGAHELRTPPAACEPLVSSRLSARGCAASESSHVAGGRFRALYASRSPSSSSSSRYSRLYAPPPPPPPPGCGKLLPRPLSLLLKRTARLRPRPGHSPASFSPRPSHASRTSRPAGSTIGRPDRRRRTRKAAAAMAPRMSSTSSTMPKIAQPLSSLRPTDVKCPGKP
mmetsp:Transcript_8820/g.22841  ORF Transcript_8820/g.22841 Transcript_8820/m.22841 type:complete len:203 (-) Transcript_8820:5139-5747(-)